MNEPHSETLLRFTGDWPALPVFGAALGLALLMFFFYRRELRYHHGAARWLPALLRALAVFIVVLCLAGPVLRHVSTYRQLGRVVIVADGSASMSFTDDASGTSTAATGTATSRFQRMDHALMDPANSLVRRLAKQHDVELFALHGYKAERLWWQRGEGKDTSGDLPTSLPMRPEGTSTSLDQALSDALGPSPAGTALVVLTDGQHNAGGSPEDFAQSLKGAAIPIFTVGFGTEVPPQDLALVSIQAPEAVFAEDVAQGSLTVQDRMPPDLSAVAVIAYHGKTLWQQPFQTTGGGERLFEFSFPVKDLDHADPKQTLRLLNFRVELTGNQASKDRITANNQRTTSLHLLTRKRRVLLLDGRARWETRYVNNHFDRDDRWDIVTAFDDFENSGSSTIRKAFPKSAEELMKYDLLILGDLRPEALEAEQHAMIQDFVEKRGGGLILIDGRRGHLQAWQKTTASGLMPVSWKQAPPSDSPMSYELTDLGRSLPAFRLSDSTASNASLWGKLPETLWIASATALADAQEIGAVTGKDQQAHPALVWRRFGAGSVLWLGTDELWRWRYEVGDLHHQRFWMQIASWIAAPPFLVEDERLSMGTDRLRYQEGDTAEIRVRLRDDKGAIITTPSGPAPRAHLLRNGVEVASMELSPDQTHGGVFRAVSGALSSGDYQITLSEGNSPPKDLKLAFRVESQANQEWGQLTLNRPLLEGMARASGGRFLREGDIAQLPDLLQQFDRKETRIQETVLWSTWWWFGAAMLLLTAEWLLRKYWRLV